MAKLIDLSRMSPLEFTKWLKLPDNIFAGNVIRSEKTYYSNTFSQFQKTPVVFVEGNAITNYGVLFGKNIGYVTAEQYEFAVLLSKLVTSCIELARNHVWFLGKPIDDYSTTINRIWKSQSLSRIISVYTSKNIGQQCITDGSSIAIIKDLAYGCFGSVHLAEMKGHPQEAFTIALKKTIDSVTKASITHAYDPKYDAWDEINIMKPYLNSLVERGICPNVPYVYANLICNTCNFVLKNPACGKNINKPSVPCSTILMELASGTLSNWAPVSIDDQYACIFQCMAGVHAIQKYFQFSNGDIKAINILYTKCTPGGYWEYVINGKSYYVPNFGGVFTVNDYGLGKCYDLSLPVCTRVQIKPKPRTNDKIADFRPFIVVNNKLTQIDYSVKQHFIARKYNGKLAPRIVLQNKSAVTAAYDPATKGGSIPYSVSLSSEQRNVLEQNSIPTDATNPDFFSNSSVVPYLSMYEDTQDMIRTFYGNNIERTTQEGTHSSIGIDPSITSRLAQYLFPVKNLSIRVMDTSFITPQNLIAGCFIDEFFQNMFQVKPGGPLLQRFVI